MSSDQMLRFIVRRRLRTLRCCVRILEEKARFHAWAVTYLDRSCPS